MSAIDSPRRELQLVAAQDDRRRAELGRRRPRTRSGSGSRASRRPARRCGRRARRRRRRRARPGFSSAARSSSSPSSNGAELLAGEEIRASSTRILRGVAAHRTHLEPLPRPRLPAGPGAVHLALAAAADRRAQRDPHRRSTATSTAEFAAMLASGEWDVALLQECPPRFAEPLARACGAEAHRVLTSRNSLGCLRSLAAATQPRPDRLRRGRLEPDPGARRPGSARRDRRAARAGDPRGPAGAAGDGLHPHRLRRSASPTCTRPTTPRRSPPRTCCARRRRRPSGRRRAAALRRRPQPAPGREPGDLRPSCASASASPRPTAPDAIDHLLVARPRGARATRPAGRPSGARSQRDGLALRLSDHAPVEAASNNRTAACSRMR